MSSMEEQILKAAECLFLEKGFNMTSTVEIARKVGCNQALVHYYFHTKENLFVLVFMEKVLSFMSAFAYIDNTDDDFFTRLTRRINQHFDEVAKSPNIPFLVINDLMLYPQRRNLLKERIVKNAYYQSMYQTFDDELKKEIAAGNIRPITTIDLLLNVVSLDAVAFLSEPIILDMVDNLPFDRKDFLEHRRQEIITTILASLRP